MTWLHARANFELLSVDHLTEDVVIPHHVPTHSRHVDRRTVVVVVVHAVGDSPIRFLRQIELFRGFIHSLVEGLESLSLSLVDYETFHGLVLLLGVGYFKYRTRLGYRLHTVLLVCVVILLQRWIRKHLVASFVGRGLYVQVLHRDRFGRSAVLDFGVGIIRQGFVLVGNGWAILRAL